ncbi:protein of unknown function [Taphrina deformans PYCC 5710]|uniref:F-box domain-containing protein n=1 Tax=Taphrina deformans (strain PYCC 5710 / ATCC 11124 / CBS 356.35 / IMI 108563 / JCM 9778 / NBRC 8474) TaxID=1097556 RepID=R4XA15_TAPDE|nr:protein of unknown function [Taphrina deformans PYCC 5710]|eukprot:CCG82623.1 protein of unknown function [Taphrina deformans PYCC 5710]
MVSIDRTNTPRRLSLTSLPREILFQIVENQRIDHLAKISLINREFAEISRTLQAGLICEHKALGHIHRHHLRHKNGELGEVTIFRYSGMSKKYSRDLSMSH